MKLTTTRLNQMIKEELSKALKEAPAPPHRSVGPSPPLRGEPSASREEIGKTKYYALIKSGWLSDMIISGDSVEELKERAHDLGDSEAGEGWAYEVAAIFTAEVLEGRLEL